MSEEQIREIIREEVAGMIRNGRLGIKTDSLGIHIGTQSTNKIGLYNATPVVRASAITAPTGGATQDAQARTAIGTIITVLQNIGVTA